MVNGGLDINEEDFSRLPTKQQNTILFLNVQEIKKMVNGWKFRQKLVLAWLSSITAIGSYLAIKILKL